MMLSWATVVDYLIHISGETQIHLIFSMQPEYKKPRIRHIPRQLSSPLPKAFSLSPVHLNRLHTVGLETGQIAAFSFLNCST